MSPKIILAAVKQNGLALQYVKNNMMTPGIILEAVRQNPRALQFVSEKTMICDEIKKIIEQYCH